MTLLRTVRRRPRLAYLTVLCTFVAVTLVPPYPLGLPLPQVWPVAYGICAWACATALWHDRRLTGEAVVLVRATLLVRGLTNIADGVVNPARPLETAVVAALSWWGVAMLTVASPHDTEAEPDA